MRALDLTGQKFNRWTVLHRDEKSKGEIYWICKCDCGTVKPVKGSYLKKNRSKSCGCLQKEVVSKSNRYELIDNEYYKVYDAQERYFFIDKEDYNLVKLRYWSVMRGYVVEGNYEDGKSRRFIHRYITDAKEDDIVDHRDGNPINNRRYNIRKTNQTVNRWNIDVQRVSKTKVLGVHQLKNGKYRAMIQTNGVRHDLGMFDDIEDAINARKKAELEQRGELSHFWKGNE